MAQELIGNLNTSPMKAYQRISEKSTSLQEIPNLLPVTKVTPKVNKENIQVTQVHGSMEMKEILEKVSAIKEDNAKKEQAKKESKCTQQQQIEPFFKCKEKCTCGKNVCNQALRMPCCNVLKSTCSKVLCRGETGTKPIMIKPFCDIRPKKSLQFESDENDIEYDDADYDMSDVYDDMSDTDKVIDDELISENGE